MMPWFKIQKHKNTSINGVDLGPTPKIEVTIEEEKLLAPKLLRKMIRPNAVVPLSSPPKP
jgi:hypothetical protein